MKEMKRYCLISIGVGLILIIIGFLITTGPILPERTQILNRIMIALGAINILMAVVIMRIFKEG